VSTNLKTPIGLGQAAAAAIMGFRINDGMNILGNYSTTRNKQAYADTTGYFSVNPPWPGAGAPQKRNYIPSRWSPEYTTTASGARVFQAHATPQMAFTVPFAWNQFNTPKLEGPYGCGQPEYVEQVNDILQNLVNLSDSQRAEIELFSDMKNGYIKFAINRMLEASGGKVQFAQFIPPVTALVLGLYDSLINSYYQKRWWDSVRPIDSINFLYKGNYVPSWGGLPGDATFSVLVSDFQTYVDSPFTSEYPSAHACMCQVQADFIGRWTGQNLQYTWNVSKGSLNLHAGLLVNDTPTFYPLSDVSIRYHTWQDWANACADSRGYSGVNFRKSIDDAQRMCLFKGGKLYDAILPYVTGNIPVAQKSFKTANRQKVGVFKGWGNQRPVGDKRQFECRSLESGSPHALSISLSLLFFIIYSFFVF